MVTLEEVLDPAYLSGLESRDLDEVRSMRDGAQRIETGVSFLRRLAQGRLDIVNHELARRREGGEPGELSDLIGRLPDILSEHSRAPGMGRPPQDLQPAVVPDHLRAALDEIVDHTDLGALPELDDGALESLTSRLADYETLVSNTRRELHQRIDALQDEIKRRYRDGEASVDSLLE